MNLRRAYLSIAFISLGAFFLLSISTQPSMAQTDWLKTGKDLLGTMTKTPQQSDTANLTEGDIASGLKDALRVGTETVVGQLGTMDGFNADPAIHIPLPDSLKNVKSALSAVGMSSLMDDLELKLTRAAE